MMYKPICWPAASTSAPALQPPDCFISSHQCVYKIYIYIQCTYTCVHRHVCVYTLKREKAFQLPHAPPGCPGAAGEEARDITQLLNCYSQVSPSAGAVLIEAETPSRSAAIYTHTHTHISFRQGGLRSGLLAVAPRLDGA